MVRMMVNANKLRVGSHPTLLPSGNLITKSITLVNLNLENVSRDTDGGMYGDNSYIYIARDNTGAISYFVTLQDL